MKYSAPLSLSVCVCVCVSSPSTLSDLCVTMFEVADVPVFALLTPVELVSELPSNPPVSTSHLIVGGWDYRCTPTTTSAFFPCIPCPSQVIQCSRHALLPAVPPPVYQLYHLPGPAALLGGE